MQGINKCLKHGRKSMAMWSSAHHLVQSQPASNAVKLPEAVAQNRGRSALAVPNLLKVVACFALIGALSSAHADDEKVQDWGTVYINGDGIHSGTAGVG